MSFDNDIVANIIHTDRLFIDGVEIFPFDFPQNIFQASIHIVDAPEVTSFNIGAVIPFNIVLGIPTPLLSIVSGDIVSSYTQFKFFICEIEYVQFKVHTGSITLDILKDNVVMKTFTISGIGHQNPTYNKFKEKIQFTTPGTIQVRIASFNDILKLKLSAMII